jgi:hypothetical protein
MSSNTDGELIAAEVAIRRVQDHLQNAFCKARPVEAIVIMGLLSDAATLSRRVSQLVGAQRGEEF